MFFQLDLTRRASADAVLSVPISVAQSSTISLSDLLACSPTLSPNVPGLFPIDTAISESQVDQLMSQFIQQKPVCMPLTTLPTVPTQTIAKTAGMDLSAGSKKKLVSSSRSNSAGSASAVFSGGQSMSPVKNTIGHISSVPDFSRRKEPDVHNKVKNRSNSTQLGVRANSSASIAVNANAKSTLPSALQSALASHLKQPSLQKITASSNNIAMASQQKSQTLSPVAASKKHTHSAVAQRDGFAVPTVSFCLLCLFCG